MRRITFTVPGKPQGKARARTGYNPKVGRTMSHTPDNTVLYENLIKTCCMQEIRDMDRFDICEESPLDVEITAYYEPAKSTSKKKREAMLGGALFPTKKPDADNIAKTVLDALNGVAYRDDSQVVSLKVSKMYGEQARVEVTVTEI